MNLYWFQALPATVIVFLIFEKYEHDGILKYK